MKISDLEFVQIDDVATSDFTAALEGVDAVIHLACALPGKRRVEETFTVRPLTTIYCKTPLDGTVSLTVGS